MAKSKSIRIPEELARDDRLSSTLKLVYAVMLNNADCEGLCCMNCKQIGEVIGMTGNAVVYSRRMLDTLGYIDIVPRQERMWCLKYMEVRDA